MLEREMIMDTQRPAGGWIKQRYKNAVYCSTCSVCGMEAFHPDYQGVKENYKFCPHCGTEMDEELSGIV